MSDGYCRAKVIIKLEGWPGRENVEVSCEKMLVRDTVENFIGTMDFAILKDTAERALEGALKRARWEPVAEEKTHNGGMS